MSIIVPRRSFTVVKKNTNKQDLIKDYRLHTIYVAFVYWVLTTLHRPSQEILIFTGNLAILSAKIFCELNYHLEMLWISLWNEKVWNDTKWNVYYRLCILSLMLMPNFKNYFLKFNIKWIIKIKVYRISFKN